MSRKYEEESIVLYPDISRCIFLFMLPFPHETFLSLYNQQKSYNTRVRVQEASFYMIVGHTRD